MTYMILKWQMLMQNNKQHIQKSRQYYVISIQNNNCFKLEDNYNILSFYKLTKN